MSTKSYLKFRTLAKSRWVLESPYYVFVIYPEFTSTGDEYCMYHIIVWRNYLLLFV